MASRHSQNQIYRNDHHKQDQEIRRLKELLKRDIGKRRQHHRKNKLKSGDTENRNQQRDQRHHNRRHCTPTALTSSRHMKIQNGQRGDEHTRYCDVVNTSQMKL